jgi:Zn-dependent peptidase ImmA (M78 family)/DNA-binding XRE family transcriptional regulator
MTATPLNPDCFRVARQSRGLSQVQLADKAGVTQGLISRLENGLAQPGAEALAKVARALGFPESFFHIPDRFFGLPVSVQYRKRASVGQRAVEQLEAEINLRLMQLRRLLAAVDYQPELKFPRLDLDEFQGGPEAIAEMVRRVWQVPTGPIRNLTELVERSGCIVFSCDFQSMGVDGLTLQPSGLPTCIFLNAAMPGDRQRFTLAHEIGHAVMHSLPTPEMENDADRFAAALLMPARDIAPQFSGGVTLQRLAALKPVWKVSMGALLVRARTVGAITESQSAYLWRQYSKARYRTQEPPEIAVAPEVPHVVSDIVGAHLGALGYSVAELAQSLHVVEDDLRAMHRLPAADRPALRIVR